MTNTCTIPIATGINKGKICKDINKYCRHKKVICDICKEEFSHKSSYERHRKFSHPNIKKKIVINKRNKMNELEQELATLKKQYHSVNARVDKVEQEPKNIIVIGDVKIFMGLVNKLGDEQKATQFLLDNMEHTKRINIVDKMYLEGVDKNRYPIACTDNYKFRYLNNSGDVVDDKDGVTIIPRLENEIHSALIEANTHLIHQHVKGGQITTDVYDMGNVQEQLSCYRKACDNIKFRNELAKKVYNTSHPFFN